jgi:uncharacterized protein (TIGR04255 family)
MSRKRPLKKLSNSPLVLVLCQVRFSPLMAMEQQYIPAIQDRLRRAGYKINASAQIQKVAVTNQGPIKVIQPHWEFQEKNRMSSVVVNPGFVVLQTTKYDTFDDFLPRLVEAIDITDDVVSGIIVQRIGLRYINLIRPKADENWQEYLKRELHGIKKPPFRSDTVEQTHQTSGETENGKLILRLWQNRSGVALPPDLAVHQLAVPPHAQNLGNELATIVDIDHYKEGLSEDYSGELLTKICWSLQNDIKELFEESIATPKALEAWK